MITIFRREVLAHIIWMGRGEGGESSMLFYGPSLIPIIFCYSPSSSNLLEAWERERRKFLTGLSRECVGKGEAEGGI
jgi:hypothetical protein